MDVLVESHGERRVRRVPGVRIRRHGSADRHHLAGGPSRTHALAGEHPRPQLHLARGRGHRRAARGMDVGEGSEADARARPWRQGRRLDTSPRADRLPYYLGTPIFSSSSAYPTSTPAVTALKQTIGNSVVGSEVRPRTHQDLGIMANANLLYEVQEFASTTHWRRRRTFRCTNAISALAAFGDIFSPGITSSRAARLYGISYLLEPREPGPKGSVFDRSLGDEDLYRGPGRFSGHARRPSTRWVVARQVCVRLAGQQWPTPTPALGRWSPTVPVKACFA